MEFLIANLMGHAHEWEGHSLICDSVAAFSAALSWVFGQPVLDQGAAPADTFYLSLFEEIKERFAMVDLSLSFEALVELAHQKPETYW